MALSLGEVTPKPFGAVHHLCLRRLSRSRQLPRTTSAESTRVSRPSSPVSLCYPPSGEDGVSPRRAMSGWRRPVRVGLIVTWNLSLTIFPKKTICDEKILHVHATFCGSSSSFSLFFNKTLVCFVFRLCFASLV